MLKLDLVTLEREGSLRIQAAIPEDTHLWDGTALNFVTPLDVDLRANAVVSGEYLVRGRLQGAVGQRCTRCLKEVRVPVDEEVTLLFGANDEVEDDSDPNVRTIDAKADELDLEPVLREELMLAVPAYAVCEEDCKGLCPSCGIDWNVETCQCAHEEPDPRWEALRALKTD